MTQVAAGATPAGAPPGEERGNADAVLFAELAAAGFAGALYDRAADKLASYGYQVLQAWVRSGDIFALCAKKKIRGLPASASWDGWADDDLDDLVQDTVVYALSNFRRDALAGKGWRPDGGASLTTYFAGACMFAFATVYKNHHNTRRRHAAAAATARQAQPAQVPDVAEAVVDQAAAAEHLAAIADPRLRLAVQLAADGYSHAEISNLLADGTTPRAVEAMLYRHRKQARGGGDGR